MEQIIQNGSCFNIADFNGSHQSLPVGNYILQEGDRGTIYLKRMEAIKLPEVEFMDTSIIDHWLKSFATFDTNLGILLSGQKGSGKTVMAKKLCVQSGLPVINFDGTIEINKISQFLASPLFKNCILFVDEFEKILELNTKATVEWLKLLDGNYNTKLLTVLTSNSDTLPPFFMNRLSRIKYRKHFSYLENSTIEKIIGAYLNDQSFKEDLLKVCTNITHLTIDLLINIIQEINTFNLPASVIVKQLNIINESALYFVEELVQGHWLKCINEYIDISNLKSAYIHRGWLSELRQSLEDIRKNNNGKIPEQILFNDKYELENIPLINRLSSHIDCSENAEVFKKDGIITIKADKTVIRLTPAKKSNLVF